MTDIAHLGHRLHLLNGDGRTTLCGRLLPTADRYESAEAGQRAWDDGRQPHCLLCEGSARR